MTADASPVFVSKDFHVTPTTDDDGETTANALLYSHAREFATGHGVAVGWDKPVEDGQRTTAVFTDLIPEYEVPLLIAPSTRASEVTLDMRALSDAATPD